MGNSQQKKPLSSDAKIALILGGGALFVLLVGIICFYSFMNKYLDQASENFSSHQGMDIEDVLPDDLESLELKAGTYKVPDDIHIAAYLVFASEEMKFTATGADGEVDIEETISKDKEHALSIITEDGDTIQLTGNGTVTFIKMGEAEDYMPSGDMEQYPFKSKDGFI